MKASDFISFIQSLNVVSSQCSTKSQDEALAGDGQIKAAIHTAAAKPNMGRDFSNVGAAHPRLFESTAPVSIAPTRRY